MGLAAAARGPRVESLLPLRRMGLAHSPHTPLLLAQQAQSPEPEEDGALVPSRGHEAGLGLLSTMDISPAHTHRPSRPACSLPL